MISCDSCASIAQLSQVCLHVAVSSNFETWVGKFNPYYSQLFLYKCTNKCGLQYLHISNSLSHHYHLHVFHTSAVALLSYTFARVIKLYTIYFWDSQACQRWLCTHKYSILLSLLIFILNHKLDSRYLLTVSIFELKIYDFGPQNLHE